MATLEQAAGGMGTVDVCGKLLTLSPLSIADERTIYKRLEAIAAKDSERRTREAYAVAAMAPTAEMRAVAVQRIIDAAVDGRKPGPSEVFRYASTPAGCAFVLWMRAKKVHAELKLEEVEAIVTETNCEQVIFDIEEAVKDPKAEKTHF